MGEEGKVLSQSEIDALLSAFGDDSAIKVEDAPAQIQVGSRALPRNVRLYDFRRPSKVSKEQLRTLTSIHEVVARLLTTSLTSHLRIAVQVTISSVDQSNYEDYIRELGENSVVSVISLEPLPGAIIWEINGGTAFSIVDRLLGGVGKALSQSRELTDIETALLKGVVRNGLTGYRDAWANIIELDPALEETYVGPQYVQIALATDTVMVAVFEFRMNEDTGTMTMCMPYSVLEPIINKLSSRALFASNRKDDGGSNMKAMIHSLQDVAVPVRAVLGSARLSLSEVLGLEVGNVLVLDGRRDEPVSVYVGERLKFKGIPKRSHKNYALKVVDVIKDYEVPDDLLEALEAARPAAAGGDNG